MKKKQPKSLGFRRGVPRASLALRENPPERVSQDSSPRDEVDPEQASRSSARRASRDTVSMTPAVIRGLIVLGRANRPLAPKQFAREMWPDSASWRTQTNVGHGSTRGVGIAQAGGAFLSRLFRAKLCEEVRSDYGARLRVGYVLSESGRALLASIESTRKEDAHAD